jgi:hypothetical protein
MRKTTSGVLFLAALWLPAIFLSTAAQLSASEIYYYNSLDSNPDDFTGTLTLQSDAAGQPLPFLTFSMSAVVDGETLNFTAADQTGSSEAIYDTNPTDPLSVLGSPTYSVVDPVLGGQELLLGPVTPHASSLGAPQIFDVPSSPPIVDASDSGVWLLTAPPSSTSTPEPSTAVLVGLAAAALWGFSRVHRHLKCN